MSASWTLYSFDYSRFEQLFGSEYNSHADALRDSLSDEDYFDFDDPDVAETVARRVMAEGFSYDNASDDEQDVLDCIPSAIFKVSDFLSAALDTQPESPEGFHINVVGELLKRAAGHCEADLLGLFDGGRRHGGATTEYCEYIIFSPTEVANLLIEAQQVIDVEAEWSQPDFQPMVEKELVEPLRKIVDANRGLAALFP